MPGINTTLTVAGLLGFIALGGCQNTPVAEHDMGIDQAVAVMHGTEGNANVSGTVRFVEADGGQVEVTADVSGLEPGSVHAIHVHEYGDCTAPDATSAGGHYNPEGHDHALPDEAVARHAGDFGNLEADENGEASFRIVVDNISIGGMNNPVIGRAVIIHAGRDKGMAEQPTGAAGPRIACGIIGVANPR